jgi:hypothetical protein
VAQPAAIVEPLGPATLTDMLDGGWRLLHRRPGTLLALGAMFLAPGALLAGLASAAVDTDVQTIFALPTSDANGVFPLAALVAWFLGMAARSLGVMYLGVALTHVVLADSAGGTLGAGAAARAALGRSGAVLGSWPLLFLASIPAVALCYLPLGVWLTFTAVVAPVIAAEGVGPIAAIGRSFSLVARRFWVALGVVMLSSLVAYVLTQVLVLVPQLLAGLLPWGGQWAVLSVVTWLAAIVTTGPLVISSVLLYLDLRVRTEGLDLRQRATAAFSRAG